MGYDKLQDPGCQKQLFCKMAVYGEQRNANTVQRTMHYFATL